MKKKDNKIKIENKMFEKKRRIPFYGKKKGNFNFRSENNETTNKKQS